MAKYIILFLVVVVVMAVACGAIGVILLASSLNDGYSDKTIRGDNG